MQSFGNCYEDTTRAAAYATLEFDRTYHLAFRDLPDIFRRHARGKSAVDFGCGTGRSTRFLHRCGFDAVGIDISPQMIAKAREIDPSGDYRLIHGSNFGALAGVRADLVVSAFTFDNIAAPAKQPLLRSLAGLLGDGGVLVNVVSSPDIYLHEWASFSTRDFPENRLARSGDVVRIVTTDYADSRPVEDILCTDASYRDLYWRAGLEVLEMHKPLATGQEPWTWASETGIAPWVIYVLGSARDLAGMKSLSRTSRP